MRRVARAFTLLMALTWLIAWAGVVVLLWRPAYEARLDVGNFSASGDITASGLGRLVATAIALAAVLIGLPVLVAALVPQRRKDLGHERTAVTPSLAPVNDEMTGEHVPPAAAERPLSLRLRGEERPAPTSGEAERQGELASLRARLDRQEEEVGRLREMVMQFQGAPAEGDEHRPASNGRV